MREFKSVQNDVGRKIRKRIAAEVTVFIIVAACWGASFPVVWPWWLGASLLVAIAAVLLADCLSYPTAKAIAETFSIEVLSDALKFSYHGGGGELLYSNLYISKVKLQNNEIVEIRLRTKFGQTIKLRGLENMKELHECLVRNVGYRTEN